MRYLILIAWLGGSLVAQPNCTGIALDVDARCGCVKDPGSKLCEMVKAGFYERHDFSKIKPLSLGWGGISTQPATRAAAAPRPQQARVVALPSKDFLRFLHPNAHLVAGFDFEKIFQSPELMESVFGQAERRVPHEGTSCVEGNGSSLAILRCTQ